MTAKSAPMPAEPVYQPGRETLIFESDWLASHPFFYNLKSGRASHNINEVIDLANVEFDPEGFNDYLNWGFSVFERTPLRDVRLLRYSSRLFSGPDGLRVEYLDDPAWAWLDRQSTVSEVLEVASAKVNAAVAGDGQVVVPTSGGLDSRLLNVLISDRRRRRSFTYGVSDDPRRSFEVVKARELARRLGIRWELIPLGDFHRYFADWDALYGVSTHAHGMYQIEFYRGVAARVEPGSVVLSGAAGESFAGQGSEDFFHDTIDCLEDFHSDFRWGEMNADSRMSLLDGAGLGPIELLEAQPRLRSEPLPRVFAALRLRSVLLSYLLSVPASHGLRPRAPYLDIDLAMPMLTLPAEQRWGRRWQREFFARQGVDLESERTSGDWRNTLNFQAMRRVPLRPLDVALLREVIKPECVRWVNRSVGLLGLPSEALWRLSWKPGFRRAAKALAPTGIADSRLTAYCAYLTLKPIEALLQRRDLARRGAESP
jgi:asparagine synthetase B (glutamine-hydrolysing)